MEGKSYKPFNTLNELRAPISGAFLLPMIWRKACMNGQTNSVVEAAATTLSNQLMPPLGYFLIKDI